MTVTTSELRANIYKLLDRALETGLPVEIKRKGRILRIVPEAAPAKLSRLRRRPGVIRGDASNLVNLDWFSEWKP